MYDFPKRRHKEQPQWPHYTLLSNKHQVPKQTINSETRKGMMFYLPNFQRYKCSVHEFSRLTLSDVIRRK